MPVPITADEIATEPECPPADKTKERAAFIAARLKEGRRPSDVSMEADCPIATVITFKLRHGVTFSDGSPMSADDVVFTFDWIMNPQVDAPRDRQALERVKSVKKLANDEVAFNFREPFFKGFDLASGLAVFSKSFYGKYTPAQFDDSVGLLDRNWSLSACHAGWVEADAGSHRTHSQRSLLGITGVIRPDRLQSGAGGIDRVGDVYQRRNRHVQRRSRSNTNCCSVNPTCSPARNHFEYLSPIAGYTFIAWNEQQNDKPTIFTDKRVRQAMTMLTDRVGLCDTILLGYSIPATGPFSPISKQNDPNLVDWKYDPAAATALLKAAGFEMRDNSGVLSRADGTKLQFKLSFPSKSATTKREMQFIHDTYARSGVAMELDPLDWTIIEQKLKNRQFDAITLGWSAEPEDDIYQMFDSSQQADQGDDFMAYSNPAFDTAIRAARATIDETKRMQIWHECQRILHEDQPYTFLTVPKSLRFIDKRIQNIKVSKTGT